MASQGTEEQREQELGSADYLERALEELDRARQQAQEELRSLIDSAISRSRQALTELREGTAERTEGVRARAEDLMEELERTLEELSEDTRRELGVRAVRAQDSPEGLRAMSEEIEVRSKDIEARAS